MWPWAVGSGLVAGLGLFLVVRELLPSTPRLQSALDRLSGDDKVEPITVSDGGELTSTQRYTQVFGAWAQRRLPVAVLGRGGPSHADLDLIGKTATDHYGEKALGAVIMLVAVPFLGLCVGLLNLGMPVSVPLGGALVLALGAWFLPDLDAKTKAKRARQEFSRAVSTYLELLAIERISGAGATQATFAAAQVAGSWPFRRIAAALERSRWEGQAPWVALRELGEEVEVDALGEVAAIVELAGTQGSAIHDQLQSKAAAMRDAQLDVEQQLAHDATVRMTVPGTLTVFVYFLMLIFPIGVTMFQTAP
ncbi:TadC protein [Promicromonospora sp. NPDC057138]|uniref:TadC protein n=1 Tax=Promicromonospora sp. NPDC057138 TaxID=3346031 RepID=UPI003638DEA4